MSRVLAVGCLAVLLLAGQFLAGRPAWAEDPAPMAPPASPGGAVGGSSDPASNSDPASERGAEARTDPLENAPEVTRGAAEGMSMLDATDPRGLQSEIDGASILQAVPPEATQRILSPWSGSLRLRYRLRTSNDSDSYYENDQDLYAYLKLKYRDEALPGWSGSVHGRVFVDLDHFGNVDGFNVYDSIWDTYGDRWNQQLYHAYVNYRFCQAPLDSVRMGRMWEDVGEYVTFDGLRFESARVTGASLGMAGIVGVPTYFYSGDRQGDFIAGLQVFAKPWRGSEVELDWTYLKNNEIYGDVENNLFNLLYNQRIGQSALAQLQYQQIDDQPRRFRATVDATWLATDIVARGYFNTLINPQAELVYDLDYYYWVALDLEPYWDAHASLSKGIGNCFDVEGGFTLRRLYDSGDRGRYNQEWERYYLAASSYDWLVQGLSLTLSGELWSGAEDIGTVLFDAEYRPSRTWRFVVGTDYAAYSFDMYAQDERQNVFSVFGRVGYRPTERWNFDLRTRVEDDDFGTYLTFDATAQFNF